MNIIMRLFEYKMKDNIRARFGWRLTLREDGSGTVDILSAEHLWDIYYDFDTLPELEYWLTDFTEST